MNSNGKRCFWADESAESSVVSSHMARTGSALMTVHLKNKGEIQCSNLDYTIDHPTHEKVRSEWFSCLTWGFFLILLHCLTDLQVMPVFLGSLGSPLVRQRDPRSTIFLDKHSSVSPTATPRPSKVTILGIEAVLTAALSFESLVPFEPALVHRLQLPYDCSSTDQEHCTSDCRNVSDSDAVESEWMCFVSYSTLALYSGLHRPVLWSSIWDYHRSKFKKPDIAH